MRIITTTDGTDEKQNKNTFFQPNTAWTYDMGGQDEKCVEKFYDLWEEKRIGIKGRRKCRTWMITDFTLKVLTVQVNWDPMYVQTVLNACTWPELEDLIYVGQ